MALESCFLITQFENQNALFQWFSGFPSYQWGSTDQINDKAVACTCNDDSNLEWSLLSKSWIEWMEWTEHQVLMVVLECVKRHPKILKTFEKLAFSINKNNVLRTENWPTLYGAWKLKEFARSGILDRFRDLRTFLNHLRYGE